MDRGCRVRTVQLAARRSASPAALQTSLDFAAKSGATLILTAEEPGRVVAGPEIGSSLTSHRLGSEMSELEPRAQFWGDIGGPWGPSVLPLALRWAAATGVLGLAVLPEIILLHIHMHTLTCPECYPPRSLPSHRVLSTPERQTSWRRPSQDSQPRTPSQVPTSLVSVKKSLALE